MPVHQDPSGHRFVQAETEVPGTPEQVWNAIATGPGITSWFVPSTVEGRVGGTTTSDFGPGMEATARITEWDPPRRFVAESDELGPNDAPVATEWIVEARGGGSCVVRVVHRWFAEGNDWDGQFEGHTHGWLSFFRVLRAYVAHFAGQAGVPVQVMGVAPPPKETAWEGWTRALGLAGASVGDRVQAPADAPPLAGTVEWAGQPAWPEELLIRLDAPAPGIAHLVPHAMGGQVYLAHRLYLFGEGAADAAAQAQAAWEAWFAQHFAPAAAPAEAC
jgi:uncharacterized protein YndB with AHSA1/START domain